MNFVILPSTGSVIGEMIMVVTLFFFFCVFVSYIAAYNTGFKPNFVMFINFLFDDYSGSTSFDEHIKDIKKDEKPNKKELFTNFYDSKYDYKSYFSMLLSNFFIKGNKFTITRK